MQESNESQAPSTESLPTQDFSSALNQATKTGDFDFVLATAKNSHKMLTDFREAIHRTTVSGDDVVFVAMGLSFLDQMIVQSSNQLNVLKQAAKKTVEAGHV